MSAMDGVDGFLRLACEECAEDPSSPSLTVSWLPDRNEWYCSFVRYRTGYGLGRVVVAKATASTLDGAVSDVLQQLDGVYGEEACEGR